MIRLLYVLLLAAWMAPAARAEFALYIVKGTVELPAPPVYDMGSIYPDETATARFRLRNVSSVPAAVYVLAADGAGFSIPGAPTLSFGLDPQAALEFTVVFRSANTGTYSAALHSEGVSILLTATVLPRLSYSVDGQPVSGLSFGTVQTGSIAARHVLIENRTALVLTVPLIAVEGNAFQLTGGNPNGSVLQPRDTAGFDLQFLPPAAGSYQGSLVIGDRSYGLSGIAADPELPKPLLSVNLPESRSARQGAVTVTLENASRGSGAGTLTLEFRPAPSNANDPGIVFQTGSRIVQFNVSPGDAQVPAALFQTGTTAGTLIFTAILGSNTAQQSVSIPAAPVAITSAQGSKISGSIELLIAGFDNTRTAGQLTYTFFDSGGNAIAPGAMQVNSTAEFTRFFESSDAGGNFLLRSRFPVTGDPTRISAFEVEFSNSAGVSRTGRISF